MSFIRAEVAQRFIRSREVILGGVIVAAGVWLIWLGGYFFVPLGLLILALGGGWTVLALRRLRFGQEGDAPGTVEVVEGQIAYFGPKVGGMVGVPELAEIQLLTMRGRRVWKLKEATGQTLYVPVEAVGAETLFDVFASLPGMDTAGLVAALHPQAQSSSRALAIETEAQLVWRRKGEGVVVR
jgi:hypothetical protein